LQRFLRGVPVGEAIRSARLDLLQQCNPLGLAYVPFVIAGLQLDRSAASVSVPQAAVARSPAPTVPSTPSWTAPTPPPSSPSSATAAAPSSGTRPSPPSTLSPPPPTSACTWRRIGAADLARTLT
jgi:hypothetical protein